jgi:TPR repeat protein
MHAKTVHQPGIAVVRAKVSTGKHSTRMNAKKLQEFASSATVGGYEALAGMMMDGGDGDTSGARAAAAHTSAMPPTRLVDEEGPSLGGAADAIPRQPPGEGQVDGRPDPIHPCPICFEEEDNAAVNGKFCAMCTACGQLFCGKCHLDLQNSISSKCPMCRACMIVSPNDRLRQLKLLLPPHRSEGRHTPNAQCYLANEYQQGIGVGKNLVEAARLMQLAAAAGLPMALTNLAFYYRRGLGVEQNDAEAVRYYQAAIDQGFAHAQMDLGQMYYLGECVGQDHVKALEWLTLADMQGVDLAQVFVGSMRLQGEGAPKDVEKAALWFKGPATRGNQTGISMLKHSLERLWPLGIEVKLIRLKTASFNGKRGVVVEGKATMGRIVVLLEGDTTPKAFPFENIDFLEESAANMARSVRMSMKKRQEEEGTSSRARDGDQEDTAAAANSGSPSATHAKTRNDEEAITKPVLKHACPICLVNEDDTRKETWDAGMCYACGLLYCGECRTAPFPRKQELCPNCNSSFDTQLFIPAIEPKKYFTMNWKLVHERPDDRHTPVAQNNLGVCYQKGEGVPQNIREACQWFQLAADGGNTEAQISLAYMYEWGVGMKLNVPKALELYTLAFATGNYRAQYNLGVMHEAGRGVPKDLAKAIELYKLSAEQGFVDAQYNVGNSYRAGRGVPQNFTEAAKWWKLAADQKDKEAIEQLHRVLDTELFSPGTGVTLVGLNNASFNGKRGEVVRGAAAAGRVVVLLDGEAKPNSFPYEKLRYTYPAMVEAHKKMTRENPETVSKLLKLLMESNVEPNAGTDRSSVRKADEEIQKELAANPASTSDAVGEMINAANSMVASTSDEVGEMINAANTMVASTSDEESGVSVADKADPMTGAVGMPDQAAKAAKQVAEDPKNNPVAVSSDNDLD